MRLFFFLLVLANLIFFAWTQGHFGTTDENHEPQRLTQELQADKLRIVRDANAPAAKTADRAERACRVINGLTIAEIDALKTAAQAAGVETRPLAAPDEKLYLVAITGLPNQAFAERKAAELLRLGITEQSTVPREEGLYEIVLGRFPAEAPAAEFLMRLNKRGIRSARVEARDQTPPKPRLEARAPAAILLQQLPLLIAPYAQATLTDCSL